MGAYCLCNSCHCYVKAEEPRCPFCGVATHRPGAPLATRSNPTRRAWWLACGGSAVLLLGCNGTASTAPSDATPALGSAPLGAWLTSGTGTFQCNGPNGPAAGSDGGVLTCDRATQWCYTFHGFDPTACASLADPCYLYPGEDACAPTGNGPEPALAWDPSLCDAGLRRCGCLNVQCSSGYCSDDDAGGITVSCGSCYGAPPARPARRSAYLSPRFRDPRSRRNWPSESARLHPLLSVRG
jgi:hypothetical protein